MLGVGVEGEWDWDWDWSTLWIQLYNLSGIVFRAVMLDDRIAEGILVYEILSK